MAKQTSIQAGERIILVCEKCDHKIAGHDEGGKGRCLQDPCKCTQGVEKQLKFKNKECPKCKKPNAYDSKYDRYNCSCGNEY